jgi:invasion protein IalB
LSLPLRARLLRLWPLFASCQTKGCFTTLDLDAKLVDTIRKSKNLSASFNDGQGSTVKVDISLVGLLPLF